MTAFKLYDMAVYDPLELHDLAAEHPDRVTRKKIQVRRLVQRCNRPLRVHRARTHLPRSIAGESGVAHAAGPGEARTATEDPPGLGYWEVNVVARRPVRHHVAVRPAENGSGRGLFLRGRILPSSRQAGRRRVRVPRSSASFPVRAASKRPSAEVVTFRCAIHRSEANRLTSTAVEGKETAVLRKAPLARAVSVLKCWKTEVSTNRF